MIKVNLRGQQDLMTNINIYAKEMDIGVQGAMERAIELICDKAQDLAPKDTGKLKASIRGVVKEITKDIYTGEIEAAVHYAKYVEFGTTDTPPQPFLEPAIEEGIRILIEEIKNAHKRATGKFKHTNL